MKRLDSYITSLVKQGGPEPNQYEELNNYFQIIGEMVRAQELTRDDVKRKWGLFDEAFSVNTMQGFVVNKPHGYAGDFEIIDRIYTEWVSPISHLQKWDRFFHWQQAPVAVRNRKDYFKNLLFDTENSADDIPMVLNIGSGPCRDIYEYRMQNPDSVARFECLDMDSNAIAYAKNLLDTSTAEVKFYCQNIFKFKTLQKYDLIWSAGLFDYLGKKQFIHLLKLLLGAVSSGGELVIGNFAKENPSKDYMEFGEWFLHHRSNSELLALAKAAGCNPEDVLIENEPSGVNLFMRIGTH